MKTSVLWLLLVTATTALAQPHTYNWYFGDRAGLNFSGPQPRTLLDGELQQLEGSAVLSDADGNLMFYTDGIRCWDADHRIMPGSLPNLPAGSHPAEISFSTAQAALIVPHPSDVNLYYVFNAGNMSGVGDDDVVLPAEYEQILRAMSYSLVDMRLRDGKGDLLERGSLNPAVELSENLGGTTNCSATGFWVLARELGANRFYAYHVGPNGLNTTPIISDAGGRAPREGAGIGQLKISPDSRLLAYSSFDDPALDALIFDFNNETGLVSNPRALTAFDSDRFNNAYGLSFAPDNRQLYVSRVGGTLIQYLLDDPTEAAIRLSAVELGDPLRNREFGTMQIAADGRIYIAQSAALDLAVLSQPNLRGAAADLRYDEVRAGALPPPLSRVSTFGLPNFMDYVFNSGPPPPLCDRPQSAFSVESVCQGACATFVNESRGPQSTWRWTFEGGLPAASSLPAPPPICYEQAGSYRVQLIVGTMLAADTIESRIEILPGPALEVSQDVLICTGASVQLQARGEGRFRWSPTEGLSDPGIPDPIASPSVSTVYTVTLEDESGCVSRDSVAVTLDSFRAIVSSAATICRGSSALISAGGGLDYTWTPSEGLDDPAIPTPLAAPERTTVYTVTVVNEFGCRAVDSVLVEVLPPPDIDLGPDLRICRGEAVSLRSGEAASYQWTPGEGLSDPGSANPLASPTTTTVYRLLAVADNGCIREEEVRVQVDDIQDLVISLPSLRDTPGNLFRLPLTISVPPALLPLDLPALDITLRYAAGLLNIEGIADGPRLAGRINGEFSEVELIVPAQRVTSDESVLLELDARGLIALRDTTAIEIRIADPDFGPGVCARLLVQDGGFGIHEYCLGYGVRTFVPLSVVIGPNPADGRVEVSVRSAANGAVHRFRLLDDFGRVLLRRELRGEAAGRFVFNTSSLATGTYHIQVRVGSDTWNGRLLVVH